MSKEIERKYRVTHWSPEALGLLRTGELSVIYQGYMSRNPVKRVRLLWGQNGKYAEITEKGVGTIEREENTQRVNFPEGERLYAQCSYTVQKIRIRNGRYEFDFFLNKLAGLEVLEIELNSVEEQIALPAGLGVIEVTHDTNFRASFHNVHLSEQESVSSLLGYNIIRETIRFSHMQPGIDATIERLKAVIGEKGFTVLAVAGPSSSGKGYFTRKIKEYFGDRAAVINLDDFFIGVTAMRARNIEHFDVHSAVDACAAAQKVAELVEGKDSVMVPDYDFKRGERAGEKKVTRPQDLLIIEGLYALYPPLETLADISVFIDVDVHGAFCRRIKRDFIGGRTSQRAAKVFEMYCCQVHPSRQRFVDFQRDFADFIVVNAMRPATEMSFNDEGAETQKKFLISGSGASSSRANNFLAVVLAVLNQEGFNEQKPDSPFHQSDTFYEAPSQHWFDKINEADKRGSGDELMRVRRTISASGKTLYQLAYKGPKDETNFLDRRRVMKLEILPCQRDYLSDYLGYRKIGEVEKFRRIFRSADSVLRVAIDVFIAVGGVWVEINGSNKGEVEALERKFIKAGLQENRFTDKSYFDLYILKELDKFLQSILNI